MHFIIPIFLALLVTAGFFPLNSSECDNWEQEHPEWLWCDDFENNTNLSDNYQDVSTNGMSITADEAYQGTHSLCQHYTVGQVDAGWISRIDDTGYPDHVFMRWYHKFEDNFEGFPPKMARIRYRHHSGDWTTIFAVHCWLENDGHLALDVYASNSSQANSSGWLPIAVTPFTFSEPENIGTWICIEMEMQLNTSAETDGAYRLWIDDTLITERLNVDLRGSTQDKINEFMLDCYWNDGSPQEQNRYYDNLVISTQKIGPCSGTNSITYPHKTPDSPDITAAWNTSHQIFFFIDNMEQKAFIRLYTTAGKQILTLPFVKNNHNNGTAVLDKSNIDLAQGIYLAVLENGRQRTPYRLIISGRNHCLIKKLDDNY